MMLKAKLNRMKQYLIREDTTKTEQEPSPMIDIPFLKEWQKAKVHPYFTNGSYCLIREVRYPISMTHGKYQFSDFLEAMRLWQTYEGIHPLSAKGLQPFDLFFFDTETTGLGGGVGNTIFLLGYAFFEQDEVVVKQHILPAPGHEIPLYESFLNQIDYNSLVTYNGKAFDWPQVKTRHTLIREHVPKLPPFGHFDLYHAARRLWKHRLSSVKLKEVEKEILGFERIDDVPGHLAPMIYFDFVERKHPEGMIKVLQHNELDVLSLITLYTHLSFQILQKDPRQSNEEQYEVARWFDYIGEKDHAKHLYQQAATSEETVISIQAKHQLATLYKKRNQFSEALTLWKQVVQYGSRSLQLDACIEIAKIYEHRKRAFNLALEYVQKAENLLPVKEAWTKKEEKLFSDILKRKQRLVQKMKNKQKNNSL
jgi:uncharacterized protein